MRQRILAGVILGLIAATTNAASFDESVDGDIPFPLHKWKLFR